MALFDPQTQALFEALCDLPPDEQRQRLAAEPDPQRREAVARLLDLDAEAHVVFDTRAGQRWLQADGPDPDTLDRFRIVRRLGAGAMGVVYEAEEDHPRRRVALKVLHAALRAPALVDLFRFEAQALAQVEHPGVPAIYEAGATEDDTLYLSMELVQGQPLDRWAPGRSSEERVELVRALAEALEAAHRAGVLHRDLKPSNILVTAHGPKLVDFGIAAPLDEAGAGAHPGTPAYMSPEARDGRALDARSDLYALGVVAYELFADGLPGHPPEPLDDPDLSDVLRRCLESAPDDRPASAAELADDLSAVLAHRPLPWKPGALYRLRLATRRHRRPLLLAGASLGLLGALVLGAQGLERWTEWTREARAAEHLVRLQASVARRLEDGQPTPARTLFDAFVADPDHAGTPAMSDAWSFWAGTRAEQDPEGQLDALAEAYLSAASVEQAHRVQAAIAQVFWRTARFDALSRLGEHLDHATREELRSPLFDAALARRDLVRARELVEGEVPLLDLLADVTPLGVDAYKATWLTLDPGIGPELLRIERDAFTFRGVTRALPHPDGWTTRKHFAVHDGTLYVATGQPGARATVMRVPPDDGPLETVATLGFSGVQRLLATPDGLWVALSYPSPGLVRVQPDGRIDAPHPPTDALDSDVLDLALVERDGRTEVAAAVGDWQAYDVRTLSLDPVSTLTGRARFGTVMDLAVVPGDPPWLLAGKVDVEPNRRLFSQEAPFGPQPGMYVLGPELAIEEVVPLPIPDDPRTSPVRTLEAPVVGDFDGDGRPDVVWTLREISADAEDLLWFLMDVRGDRRSRVVAGLEAYAAADLDADGDDELLVGDEEGALWVLGTGDGQLPVWEPRQGERRMLGLPPTADPVVRRTWSRAQALADLGLIREAARAIAVLPGMADDPVVNAASHAEAASLFAAAGEVDAAAAHYGIARELGADVSGELLDARLAALDPRGADALLPVPHPVRTLLDPSLDGWDLRQPAFHRPQGALEIDATNDQGVLARRPVTLDGDWFQLDLEVDVLALELGAGLLVSVEREGTELLSVGFWGQGGGGMLKVVRQCGWRQLEYLDAPLLDPRTPHSLSLRAGRQQVDEPVLRCAATLDGEPPRAASYDVPPVVPGPAELVIRAHGDPTYSPPTRVRARLQRLSGVGILPGDALPDARAHTLRALFEGEPSDRPPVEPELAARWAVATGSTEVLREALDACDAPARRRLIRHAPQAVLPLLERALPPAALADLLQDTVDDLASNQPWQAELAELLALPSLTSFPVHTGSGRHLRIWRAQTALLRGRRAEARSLAESVVQADAADPATVDALLLLARLQPDVATGLLERAAQIAGVPEPVYDRARRFPELAGVIP